MQSRCKRSETGVTARRFLGVTMAVFVFALTLFPGTVAFSVDKGKKEDVKAKVEYVTDKDGFRTGIKSIELDPFRYYDISDGDDNAELNSKFIRNKVLGGMINNDKNKMTVAEAWGHTAARIFRSAGKFGSYDGTKGFNKNFGRENRNKDWNIDLGKALGQADASSKGKDRWSNVRVSGLTEFSAGDKDKLGGFDQLRHEMAKQIAASYGRKTDEGKILSQPTGKDDSALPDMKSRSESGFYNIVTSLADGISPRYYYNAFGIAFYDFELNPVSAKDLQYISDLEKYKNADDPVRAAAKDKVSGVEYTEDEKTDEPKIFYHENRNDKADSHSDTFEMEESNSYKNSVSKSVSHSFSESLGVEVGYEESLTPISKLNLKVSMNFTTTQAFGTTTEKEASYTYNNKVSSALQMDVPPHTERTGAIQPVKSTLVIPYDCPVVVSYKVMIFGMNGKFTSTSKGDSTFGTAGYPHAYFSTRFGGETKGKSAQENLYRRGVECIKDKGYDASHGKTSGKFHIVGAGHGTYSQDHIDWDTVTDKESEDTQRDYKTIREDLGKHAPMLSCSSKMTIVGKGFKTMTSECKPLFPLKTIELSKGEKIYSLAKGDTLDLDDLDVAGYDKDKVPYYSFDSDKGYWQLRDKNGNPMGEEQKHNAEIVKDPVTKEESVLVHKTGKYYLVYMISENAHYTAKEGTGEATNENLKSTAIVILEVKDSVSHHFDSGELMIKDSVQVVADDEPMELEHLLDPVIKADKGEQHAVPVTWEAKETEGMRLEEDGTADFYEPGTYHVRASYKNYKSNWSKITAKEARKLDKIKFKDKGKSEIKVTLKEGRKARLHLDRFIGFYDQHGDEWTGHVPEISFAVSDGDDDGTATEINGNLLDIRAPGEYEISAKADGFDIDPLVIKAVSRSSGSDDDKSDDVQPADDQSDDDKND